MTSAHAGAAGARRSSAVNAFSALPHDPLHEHSRRLIAGIRLDEFEAWLEALWAPLRDGSHVSLRWRPHHHMSPARGDEESVVRIQHLSSIAAMIAAIVLALPARGSDTINLNTGEVTEISTFTASGGNTDKGLVQINAGGDYSVNLPTRTMRAWATATLSGKSETAAFMSTTFSVGRGTKSQASGQVRIELTGINYSGTLSALGASTAFYKLTMKVSQTPPVSGNPQEEVTISQGSATAISTKSFSRTNGTSHVDMTVLAGRTYEVRIDLIVGAGGANLVSNAIADFNNDSKKVSVGAVRLTVLNATLPVSGPGRPK